MARRGKRKDDSVTRGGGVGGLFARFDKRFYKGDKVAQLKSRSRLTDIIPAPHFTSCITPSS